jgi:restriction endonuclease S subunit
VNFWRLTPLFRELFSRSRFPNVAIGELSEKMQYGCSSLAKSEPIGIPMLRMNNLQDNGWDLSNLKYIQMNEDDFQRYHIDIGDLLFNRTNSKELVGKCEVFDEPGDWVFASYLIRVRLYSSRVIPRFAADFLNTRAGRLQIDRLSRQIIGMTNINAEELREILLPLPSDIATQQNLVAAMDAARSERRSKLAKADALLAGLDDFLLSTLGLTPPPKDERKVFAATLRAIREQSHLNADYFHPERIHALRAIASANKRISYAKLSEIVAFIRNQIKTPSQNYLSLAHIQSHTGELVEANEEATGACSEFIKGDVLFARLRPYLNKVYCAEMDGCCSPEFHVLRVLDSQRLLPDYLAAILRSALTLSQTRHMMSGNTHPRLSNEDVINLTIPVPTDVNVQQTIAAEASRRREEARRLRIEAESGWQAAKRWFEEQLLGSRP